MSAHYNLGNLSYYPDNVSRVPSQIERAQELSPLSVSCRFICEERRVTRRHSLKPTVPAGLSVALFLWLMILIRIRCALPPTTSSAILYLAVKAFSKVKVQQRYEHVVQSESRESSSSSATAGVAVTRATCQPTLLAELQRTRLIPTRLHDRSTLAFFLDMRGVVGRQHLPLPPAYFMTCHVVQIPSVAIWTRRAGFLEQTHSRFIFHKTGIYP